MTAPDLTASVSVDLDPVECYWRIHALPHDALEESVGELIVAGFDRRMRGEIAQLAHARHVIPRAGADRLGAARITTQQLEREQCRVTFVQMILAHIEA